MEALAAGADDFVMNPFTTAELLTKPAATVRLQVNDRATRGHPRIFPTPSTSEAEPFRVPAFTACWPIQVRTIKSLHIQVDEVYRFRGLCSK
jgi:DNA-binding response OmpR family regulator